MTNNNNSQQRRQKWPKLNADEAIAYVSFADSLTFPTWAWWRSLQGFTQMPALHSEQEDVPYSCLHCLLTVRCQRLSWPRGSPLHKVRHVLCTPSRLTLQRCIQNALQKKEDSYPLFTTVDKQALKSLTLPLISPVVARRGSAPYGFLLSEQLLLLHSLFGYVIISFFSTGKEPWKCFMLSRDLEFLKKKKK